MNTIHDYSWQQFQPVEERGATVGALKQLADDRDPQPFVFYDPSAGFSALIFPARVKLLVSAHQLDSHLPAQVIGLYDMLAQQQITVPADAPALPVLSMAAAGGLDAVISLDPGSGRPIGLLIPSVSMERITSAGVVRSQLPMIAGKSITSVPDYESVVREVEANIPNFHSETANIYAPDPYICEGNGKPHTRSACPCDVHPGAGCARQQIADQ